MFQASDEGLTLETSAFLPFTAANLHFNSVVNTKLPAAKQDMGGKKNSFKECKCSLCICASKLSNRATDLNY